MNVLAQQLILHDFVESYSGNMLLSRHGMLNVYPYGLVRGLCVGGAGGPFLERERSTLYIPAQITEAAVNCVRAL